MDDFWNTGIQLEFGDSFSIAVNSYASEEIGAGGVKLPVNKVVSGRGRELGPGRSSVSGEFWPVNGS